MDGRRVDLARRQEDAHLAPVVDARTLRAMQAALESVAVEDSIGRYIVALTSATREHASALVGSSPRGSLAIYRTAQARAMLDGRDFVIPDDVKELAYSALGHRVIVSPSARVKSISASDIILGCLERVPVPGTRARGGQPR